MRRAVLLLTALAALAAPTGAVAAPQLGINVNGGADGAQPRYLEAVDASGVTWARTFLFWQNVERADDRYDQNELGGYDRLADGLAQRGVKLDIVVTGAPAWASGSDDGKTPPRDPAKYGEFMQFLADRYRGRVQAWEIWNEQDEGSFWTGAPQPERYTALLKAGYRGVKAADPGATVLFGPTTGNNYAFLDQAYAAGAKGSFDAMAVHTDIGCGRSDPTGTYKENGRIGRFAFLGYRSVRAVMAERDDLKPIWMTEFGYSTSGVACEGITPLSEADQARYLSQALHCVAGDPYLEQMWWFVLADEGPDQPNTRFGLRRTDFSTKPSWDALLDFARNGDRLTGPCGDLDGPQLTVRSPEEDIRVTDSILVDVSATDRDVEQIAIRIDGRPSGSTTAASFRKEVGVKRLALGRHTLEILARDKTKNVTRIERPFTRVAAGSLPATKPRLGKPRLSGKGRRRTVRTSIASGLSTKASGLVRVRWDRFRKGRYRKVHGDFRNARNPKLVFKQKLRSGGRWRVRVEFAGKPPFRSTKSRWVYFRV